MRDPKLPAAADAEESVAAWVRPAIRALQAYHVPDARGLIKLDAMENSHVWPDTLVQEWLARLRGVQINRYPDPTAGELRAALRAAMAVPPGADILLGNGSDELIQMIAMALAGHERTLLTPEPGFAMYRLIAAFAGMQYVGVPLAEDFGLDTAAILAAVETHRPAVVFLAYPNNPTGNLFDTQAMHAVIDAAPGLVVVDEAYHAFAEASFMDQLERYPNLLVMRTVSKMGLAGLRLGLLAGAPAWLREIDKVRLPYNINVLTQASVTFALEYRDVLEAQTRQIQADREALYAELSGLPDVQAFPSRANFVLFRVPPGRATAVFEGLRAHGVLIKNLDAAGGPLEDCLRVTVGRPDENAAFLAALRRVL